MPLWRRSTRLNSMVGVHLSSVTRPNTRVQRTRSSPSALRSPLTRRPLGHGRVLEVWVAAFAMALASRVAAGQTPGQSWLHLPTKPSQLAGFGSHPLNSTIASMWFASAPMPAAGMRPALMVYYRGPEGWLSKDVTPFADLDRDPAIADFLIGDVRLLLKFWPEKGTINLFDQEVSVVKKNVVVVTGVGVPGSTPVIKAVATFREIVPDGANPALFVLQHTPDAVKALK
jgi:hypothetical protein